MRIINLFAITVLILAAVFPLTPQSKKAPDFSLKTADGKTLTLSELKGKVVLVNFWATWCGPCRAEIPGFEEVYKKYRSGGFEIVGVSLDRGGWKDVNPFLKKFPVSYPIVIGDGKLVEAYGNFDAIPTTFLVDKSGAIVKRHIGYLSKEDLEKEIKPLL